MNRFEKASAFGSYLGKQAANFLDPDPAKNRAISALVGALAGGLGTAGYDWVRGRKHNKLHRALLGTMVGGASGASLHSLYGYLNKPKPKTELDELLDYEEARREGLDRQAYERNANTPEKRDLLAHNRMIHPASVLQEDATSNTGWPNYTFNHGLVSPKAVGLIKKEIVDAVTKGIRPSAPAGLIDLNQTEHH